MPGRGKLIAFLGAALLYLLLPFFFITAAHNADMHYAATLSATNRNAGKKVEIDRGVYDKASQTIRSYPPTPFTLNNPPEVEGKTLSIRGLFDQDNRITVTAYHEHKQHRDYASYGGLLWILLLWGASLVQLRKKEAMETGITQTGYTLILRFMVNFSAEASVIDLDSSMIPGRELKISAHSETR